MEASKTKAKNHDVVTREEWLIRRKELLEKEKAHLKATEELAQARRELPWELVDKPYSFVPAAGGAPVPLKQLFGDHDTLVVQHVMFEEEWDRPCQMCAAYTENFVRILPFVEQRARFVIVVAASAPKLQAALQRKEWTQLPAYSAGTHSEFGRDFAVSFTKEEVASKSKLYNYGKSPAFMEELFGFSVFKREGDHIYHTYSTYSAGLSELHAALKLFDLLPGGRGEQNNLDWTFHMEDRHTKK